MNDHAAKITAYYKKLKLWQTYVNRDEFGMFSKLENYIAGKSNNIKDTIIGHLEKMSKKMEQYYGDVLASSNKLDWIIDQFAVPNWLELPLCVAEEFMKMTAEPANRNSFNSFKRKTPKTISKNFLLGFNTFNLSNSVRIRGSTIDSICYYLALRSRI